MIFRFRSVMFASVFAFLWPAVAAAQDLANIPALESRVTDTFELLSEEEVARIETLSASLEERKGSQVAVLTVASTAPESIEQYSLRVAEDWKIGRAGVDDGILIVVAFHDRKVRIEVGYGLEGAVPDAVAKRIIEEEMVPRFREDRYGAGIEAAVEALVARIDPEALPPPTFEESASDFVQDNRAFFEEHFRQFAFFVFGCSLFLALWRINFWLGFLLPLILIGPPSAVFAYFIHQEWLIVQAAFFGIYVVILLYLWSGLEVRLRQRFGFERVPFVVIVLVVFVEQ